jgi:hypothetical protein
MINNENQEKKICTQCNESKDISEFYKNGSRTHYWCKKCMNHYSSCWYKEMKDRISQKKNNQFKKYKIVKGEFSEKRV